MTRLPGFATGRVRPPRAGRRRAPEPELIVHEDGRLDGTLGRRDLDAALVEGALEALKRGTSRTLELGDASYFVEVFPVRPRLVVVGAVEVARSLVRLAAELGYETVVVDGRASFATASGSRTWIGWSSAGLTRSRRTSAWARTTRLPS